MLPAAFLIQSAPAAASHAGSLDAKSDADGVAVPVRIKILLPRGIFSTTRH
jgi:hypothetical protein